MHRQANRLNRSKCAKPRSPQESKRASHIDPPASSNAIMRRARPYRGENPEPGKDVTESLTPRPELENPWRPFSRRINRRMWVGAAAGSRDVADRGVLS